MRIVGFKTKLSCFSFWSLTIVWSFGLPSTKLFSESGFIMTQRILWCATMLQISNASYASLLEVQFVNF